MKQKIFIITTLIFCAALFNTCLVSPAWSVDPILAQHSAVAPDFTLKDLQGNRITLSDFKGKKPVLLVFFTTWCPYCRAEVPNINNISSRYRSSGLEVIGVDIQEPREKVSAFADRNKINFPVLLDSDGKIFRQYRVAGVPARILITKEGKVVCNPCQSLNMIPSLLKR